MINDDADHLKPKHLKLKRSRITLPCTAFSFICKTE